MADRRIPVLIVIVTEAPVPETLETRREDESAEVWRRRFHEAHAAGLSLKDASLFANGNEDIGLLRQLVRGGATARQIARIML